MGGSRRQVVETYRTVDSGTGELLDHGQVVRVVTTATEDNYWKVYVSGPDSGLGSVPFGVLNGVLQRMGYASEGQIVLLDRKVKDQIAESVGGSVRTVERGVKAMAAAGALVKLRRGMYQVNPFFFGKGSWKDIQALRDGFMDGGGAG